MDRSHHDGKRRLSVQNDPSLNSVTLTFKIELAVDLYRRNRFYGFVTFARNVKLYFPRDSATAPMPKHKRCLEALKQQRQDLYDEIPHDCGVCFTVTKRSR